MLSLIISDDTSDMRLAVQSKLLKVSGISKPAHRIRMAAFCHSFFSGRYFNASSIASMATLTEVISFTVREKTREMAT